MKNNPLFLFPLISNRRILFPPFLSPCRHLELFKWDRFNNLYSLYFSNIGVFVEAFHKSQICLEETLKCILLSTMMISSLICFASIKGSFFRLSLPSSFLCSLYLFRFCCLIEFDPFPNCKIISLNMQTLISLLFNSISVKRIVFSAFQGKKFESFDII